MQNKHQWQQERQGQPLGVALLILQTCEPLLKSLSILMPSCPGGSIGQHINIGIVLRRSGFPFRKPTVTGNE